MAKIVVTGKTGQLGHALESALQPLGEVVATDRSRIDLSEPDTIRAVIRAVKPDLIVNAAAYTAVDNAENEPERAQVVNGTAPGILAEEAKRLGSVLIHYSTDYVFDGTNDAPYVEGDPTRPINTYGRTKLAGEEAIQQVEGKHVILRTSWLYSNRGSNFLRTMLRLASEDKQLRVVDDQVGCPTWVGWVARATVTIAREMRSPDALPSLTGLYHLSSQGETSWYGFAQALLNRYGHGETEVIPVSTDEYDPLAPRPAYSVLSTEKVESTFGLLIPSWQEQLEAAHDHASNTPS